MEEALWREGRQQWQHGFAEICVEHNTVKRELLNCTIAMNPPVIPNSTAPPLTTEDSRICSMKRIPRN